MKFARDEVLLAAVIAIVTGTPALAVPAAPAPVAGVGLGAALLVGAGYRALKHRIGR